MFQREIESFPSVNVSVIEGGSPVRVAIAFVPI